MTPGNQISPKGKNKEKGSKIGEIVVSQHGSNQTGQT